MQISALPVQSVQPVQNQRQDIVERVQRDVQRGSNRSVNDEQSNTPLAELVESSDQLSLQSTIESLLDAARNNNSQQQNDNNLSFNSRQALQAFNENIPSPQQQLGIELVGVDTFA